MTQHRSLMDRFEKAVIERSWIGAAPPEDHEAIEREYEMAKVALITAIERLTAGRTR